MELRLSVNWKKKFLELSTIAALLFLALAFLRIYEYFLLSKSLNYSFSILPYQFLGLAFDLRLVFFIFLLGIIVSKAISPKVGKGVFIFLSAFIIISEFSLIYFFSQRGSPLDHELFRRNINELLFVAKTGNVPLWQIASVVVLLAVFVYTAIKVRIKIYAVVIIAMIFSLFTFLITFNDIQKEHLAKNKFSLLISDTYSSILLPESYIFQEIDTDLFDYINKVNYSDYLGSINSEFPFLKKHDSCSKLYPFFELKEEMPNIVFIIVESLCRASSGEGAYMGSFTPFLDSLSKHSLYWENCLSSSECTFNVLPSVMGSLPYGAHGLLNNMNFPEHITLYTYLQELGYQTPCYYGTDAEYDNTRAFLEYQNVSYLKGSVLPEQYAKMSLKGGGWTWGYPDKAIFDYGFNQSFRFKDQKTLTTYITISTHPPFGFEEQDAYTQKALERLKKSHLTAELKKAYAANTELLGSFLYVDDQLKDFFKNMSHDETFDNTIFIITGDHHQYSSQKYRLDGYHVPLIIYSPLLKKTKKFQSVVNHGNITPSIINLFNKQYNYPFSTTINTFVNGDLDTIATFSSDQLFIMMGCNKEFSYVLKQDTLFNLIDVFKLHAIDSLEDISQLVQKENYFDIFKSLKQLHREIVVSDKILPKGYRKAHDEMDFVYEPKLLNTRFLISKDSLYNSLIKKTIDKDINKIKIELKGKIYIPEDIEFIEEQGPFVVFSVTGLQLKNEVSWSSNTVFQSVLPEHNSEFQRFRYVKTVTIPESEELLEWKLYIYNPNEIEGIKLRNLQGTISIQKRK